MKKIINLLLLSLIILTSACRKEDRFSTELNYSFKYLDSIWSIEQIEKFKDFDIDNPEKNNYHFGIGLNLRNNLLRHHEKSDEIIEYFNDLGIEHYDYMSGLILHSYHRYLNNEKNDIQEKINEIIEYERPFVECRNQRKKLALKNFNRLKINDSIEIKMPVSIVGGRRSVVSHDCSNSDSNNWIYENSKDLLINGLIKAKRKEKDTFTDSPKKVRESYYLRVEILKIDKKDTQYFMEDITIGDEIEFSLEYSFDLEKTTGNNVHKK